MNLFIPILALGFTLAASAADWPQFLGPHRAGVADSSEAPIAVPSGEPKILWRVPLGTGFAGPAVADGKVIVFHRIDNEVRVQALDPTTGKALWTFSYPTDYVDGFGFDNGPRATPTVSGGKVFVHGAEGLIHALDLQTGKKLWSVDTAKEFQSAQGYFGRASAPVAIDHENQVVVAIGGHNEKGSAGLIALHETDGTLAWQALDDEASYSSPIISGKKGGAMVFVWMRNNLSVCDTSGRTLVSVRHRSSMDASVNAATPIRCGPSSFFTSACYGVGGTVWSFELDPSLKTGSFKKVWSREGVLDCHYSTPVFYKDHLYGFHGRQEQGQTLRCIRASDGKVMWESPKVPGGALLRVQDTLAAVTEAGELWLISATPDKFNQLSATQILRAGHRSFPALANGILYARDGTTLVAVDLHAK